MEFAFVKVADRIRVDAAVDCGQRYEAVAWIAGPYSNCPGLLTPKPLGFDACQQIMEKWRILVGDSVKSN